MCLCSRGALWFGVGVNRQEQHLEPGEWVRLMPPVGEQAGCSLNPPGRTRLQAPLSRGAGFREHPQGLREFVFLVLEPGVGGKDSTKPLCGKRSAQAVGSCL